VRVVARTVSAEGWRTKGHSEIKQCSGFPYLHDGRIDQPRFGKLSNTAVKTGNGQLREQAHLRTRRPGHAHCIEYRGQVFCQFPVHRYLCNGDARFVFGLHSCVPLV
jgi:hypothetical protein